MDFEFDPAKNEATLRDRGFDFAFVARIFAGRVVEIVDQRRDYGELRVIAIGEIEAHLYTVVYTDRVDVRRIISAHRASRQEKRRWHSSA